MKTFVISSERLDSLIEKLWEKSEERNVSICLTPKTRQVSVIEDNATVALIDVLDVVDEYDIVSDLF